MDEVSCCGTAAIFAVIGLAVSVPPGRWRNGAGLLVILVWAGIALSAQGAPGSLRPGHLVTGTVKDAAGNPVSNVLVTAVMRDERAAITRGRDAAERPYRIVQANLGAGTDARGRYELSLPFAGDFYLVALPRQAGDPPRVGYGNTFYPNAASFAKAVAVTVKPGGPLSAHITLVQARLGTVSGTVFDSTGAPAKSGRLLLSLGDGLFGVGGGGLAISPDGRFSIENLPPGTYFLHFRESNWPPARGTVPVISTAKVVVNGADISDVRVVPTKPVRATGRLIIEGRELEQKAGAIRVSAMPTPIDGNPGPSYSGTVNADGAFEFRAWPLRSRIRVFVEEREYTVKTVRLNGLELPHGLVDFENLKDVSGVEVVVR